MSAKNPTKLGSTPSKTPAAPVAAKFSEPPIAPISAASATKPKPVRAKSAASPALDAAPAKPAKQSTAAAPAVATARAAAPIVTTRIEVRFDVGYGNALFIRGDGGGLSWEAGQPMLCVEGDRWVWTTELPVDRLTYKVLVNDSAWCLGDNFVIEGGAATEVSPAFY